MNESQHMTKPHSYTDFNDLHVNYGIEAVREQFETAISSLDFPPAPPINSDNNFQGQMHDNDAIYT